MSSPSRPTTCKPSWKRSSGTRDRTAGSPSRDQALTRWREDRVHGNGPDGFNDDVYVMNADGTNQRLLPSRLSSAPVNEAGVYGQPFWSPGGSKIAYSYPTEYSGSGTSPSPRQSDIAVLSLDRDTDGNFVVTSDVQLTS